MRKKRKILIGAALSLVVGVLVWWLRITLVSSPSGHFVSTKLVGDDSLFHFSDGTLLLELVGDKELFKIGNYYRDTDGGWVLRFSVGHQSRWRIKPRLLSIEVSAYNNSNLVQTLKRKWFHINYHYDSSALVFDGNILYTTNKSFYITNSSL